MLQSLSYAQDDEIEELREPKPVVSEKPKPETTPKTVEKKTNTEHSATTDKKVSVEKPKTDNKPIVEKKPAPEKAVNDKPVAKVVTPPTSICPTAQLTPEDKLLIQNAEDLDKLNKELSIKNQEMQQLNEKLSLQLEVLKHDRYSEGTRDTLISIAAGLLLGWFFFRQKKRSYRDFR